jgi:hypothetical protein
MSQSGQSWSSGNVCAVAIHPIAAQKQTFRHFSFAPLAESIASFLVGELLEMCGHIQFARLRHLEVDN